MRRNTGPHLLASAIVFIIVFALAFKFGAVFLALISIFIALEVVSKI